MPLIKTPPASSSQSARSSPAPHRNSGSGFHPFGGRVSRHFGDSVSATTFTARSRGDPLRSRHRSNLARAHRINRLRQSSAAHTSNIRAPMSNSQLTTRRTKLAPDEAYLSYHDIRLTREDVTTIKNDWLTDNAIAFWEEYLEREKLCAYPKAQIVLLRPSMAYMLQVTRDPLSLKSALPDFSNTTHIFLPVNDCRDVTRAEGGSHWSLLLVSLIDGVAFHYDSLCPSNVPQAKTTAYKISQLMGRQFRFINLDDSPQQENSMDCGVYVCILMQHLLMQKLLRAQAQEKVSMSMHGKEVDAAGGRKEMIRVIEERRKEGERRRSRSHSPYKQGSKSRSPPRIGDEQEIDGE